MLFLTLLLSTALSQDIRYLSSTANYATPLEAATYCLTEGLVLCSREQLYGVVFGNAALPYAQPQVCLSGHLTNADHPVGWWNADPFFCSGYGWKAYVNPNGPGAHCCSANMPHVTPVTCGQAGSSICTGTRILLDGMLDQYCTDGICTDEVCCQDFTPAALYMPLGVQTDFGSALAAITACESYHPDYTLCTATQIEDLTAAGHGVYTCSSGWMWNDQASTPQYQRMWLNTEEEAAAGLCGGIAGWRVWAPSNGFGSAHCCVSSYTKSGYHALGDTTGLSRADVQELGRNYCEALPSYDYKLCTKAELLNVAYSGEASAENICMSGVLEDGRGNNFNDVTCGWEQVLPSVCGDGSTGWKNWCPAHQGAHCCLTYVQDYVPDYTKPDHGYDIVPDNYADSLLTSGDLATAECVSLGFSGLCTVEQLKHVANNQANFGNMGCKTGWITMQDGSYNSGHWGTACGKEDELYDTWQPAVPVAHCCDVTVPSDSIVTVLDPMVIVPGKFPYSYNTFAEAVAAGCDTANGYSICTRDQVETVARVGVVRSDGLVQLEENICNQGYMADGSKGWYQVLTGCSGTATGWRSFNGMANLFCCLDFESQVGTPPPTLAPSIPVYVFLDEWVYPYETAAEAHAACTQESPLYQLCTDDEVYTIALFGQTTPSDQTVVEGVPPFEECYSGWVNSEDSLVPDGIERGWYQVKESCGPNNNQWNSWSVIDSESVSGFRAGAHCCVSNMINALIHPGDGTVDVVTETPTPSPVTPETLPPTPSPVALTISPTTGFPTVPPVVWSPYSDLPSTIREPDGCIERPDLVPQDFNGIIQYCATDDLIYLNGQTTCVDPAEPNAADLVREAFETNWYLAHGSCDGRKSYDLATDDQLFLTNHMLDVLEDDIDSLEAGMAAESNDLELYLDTWKTEVADLISGSLDQFDTATQVELSNFIVEHLEDNSS